MSQHSYVASRGLVDILKGADEVQRHLVNENLKFRTYLSAIYGCPSRVPRIVVLASHRHCPITNLRANETICCCAKLSTVIEVVLLNSMCFDLHSQGQFPSIETEPQHPQSVIMHYNHRFSTTMCGLPTPYSLYQQPQSMYQMRVCSA